MQSDEGMFTECLRDNFFYQHIDEPTRWRGTDTPHVLDLIITNEEDMVTNLVYESPLGKSDHCVIKFNFNCYAEIKERTKEVMYYDKADYEMIVGELKNYEWNDILDREENINDKWEKFQEYSL